MVPLANGDNTVNYHTRLLVVGATGSIGRHVVAEAVREGYAVHALVREPGHARHFPPGVEVVVGELTQPESLNKAVADVDAIIFTHGTYGGIWRLPGRSTMARCVMCSPTCKIAGFMHDRDTDRKGAHDWKRRGERLLRASGLPYTIVRPGWFDYNKSNQRRLVMLQGDRRQSGTPRDGVIARDQIAKVLVRSLRSETALSKTFELIAEAGSELLDDLDPIFALLDPDPAGALDGVYDAANMPLTEEPQWALEDLKVVIALSNATSD